MLSGLLRLKDKQMSRVSKKWADFYRTSKIVTDENFYGREDIIARLLVSAKENIRLIGIRRLGKSSLLRELKRRIKEEKKYMQKFSAIYLDFQKAMLSPHKILSQLTNDTLKEALGLKRLTIKKSLTGDDFGSVLGKLVKSANEKKITLLLLCDEIEDIIQHVDVGQYIVNQIAINLDEADHFKVILGLNVTLDTPSAPSYFESLTKSFSKCYLGGLDDDAALELCRLEKTEQVPIQPEIADQIVEATGRHPYFIRELCFHYFFNEGDLDAAKGAVLNETTDSIFSDNIKDLSDIRKNIMWLLAAKGFTPEELATKLNLEPLTIIGHLGRLEKLGLLTKDDEKWKISNVFFKDWLNQNRSEYVQQLLAKPEPFRWLVAVMSGVIAAGAALVSHFFLNRVLVPSVKWSYFVDVASAIGLFYGVTLLINDVKKRNEIRKKFVTWITIAGFVIAGGLLLLDLLG